MDAIEPYFLYSLFLNVIRLHYLRTHELLEKINVYPGQPPLLLFLHKHGGLSQSEIAEKLKVKPATITVMLNRIEKAGLIVRKQDENDQRVLRVYITEKGKEVCNKIMEIFAAIDRECFGNFNESERETLTKLFRKMADNLRKVVER